MKYNAGLLLGRYQLLTEGHLAGAIKMSAEVEYPHIGIGSVNRSRDTRNPWTFEERCEMWKAALPPAVSSNFRFFGQEDLGNPFRWASAIENRMSQSLANIFSNDEAVSVGLYGHRKDQTSFYLDDFPHYILEQLPNVDNINASDLREGYFRLDFDAWRRDAASKVPKGVLDWLANFRSTDEYEILAEEASRQDRADIPWKKRDAPDQPGLPHDVIFIDAAAVVVQGNRVLLHRRNNFPGKGYWSLPEAPLHLREDPKAAAIRIAIEKTSIDVSETMLRKSLRDSWTMTDPYRTTRGRTISLPSVFHLNPTPRGKTPEERRKSMALPRLRADGNNGFFTFDEVRKMRPKIYADHAIIIDQALERLGIKFG